MARLRVTPELFQLLQIAEVEILKLAHKDGATNGQTGH